MSDVNNLENYNISSKIKKAEQNEQRVILSKKSIKPRESMSFKGKDLSAIDNAVLDFTVDDHLVELKENNRVEDDENKRRLNNCIDRLHEIILEEVDYFEENDSKTNVNLLLLKADMKQFLGELEKSHCEEEVPVGENKMIMILRHELSALKRRFKQISDPSYLNNLNQRKKNLELEKQQIQGELKNLKAKERVSDNKNKKGTSGVHLDLKNYMNDFNMLSHLIEVTNEKHNKVLKSISDSEKNIEQEMEKFKKLQELTGDEREVIKPKAKDNSLEKKKELLSSKISILKRNEDSIQKKYETEIGVLIKYAVNLEEVKNKWSGILKERTKIAESLQTLELTENETRNVVEENETHNLTAESSVDNTASILKAIAYEEDLIAEIKEVLRASLFWKEKVKEIET